MNEERTEQESQVLKYRQALNMLTTYVDDLVDLYTDNTPDHKERLEPGAVMEGVERSLAQAFALLESDKWGKAVAADWNADLSLTLAAFYVDAASKADGHFTTPDGETLTLEHALEKLHAAVLERQRIAAQAYESTRSTPNV